MLEFSLKSYSGLLEALKTAKRPTQTFAKFFSGKPGERATLIRHDVDRFPGRAVEMAKIENEFQIQATYYFRRHPRIFDLQAVGQIKELGHEIGYHYENLSEVNGDPTAALEDFKTNLATMRKAAAISTVSMHGSPFSRWNNLDLFRNAQDRQKIFCELGILGDAVLDVDYSDFLFVTDTGRNFSYRNNRRDRVESRHLVNFRNVSEICAAIVSDKYSKICLQMHPERWNRPGIEYLMQWGTDLGANTVKALLSKFSE